MKNSNQLAMINIDSAQNEYNRTRHYNPAYRVTLLADSVALLALAAMDRAVSCDLREFASACIEVVKDEMYRVAKLLSARSDLESLVGFAEDDLDFDQPDIVDLLERYEMDHDFEIAEYRFIHSDEIDAILASELKNDPYILGCFTDWFLESVTEVPAEIIKAAQEGEQYELIGEWLIGSGYVEKIAERYIETDGYGHHFAHYDGHTLEHGDYYIFRVN